MPKKFTEPRIRREYYLPESLSLAFDLYLFDPMRGKPKFGRRSEVVEGLIREFLSKQKVGNPS